jgi:hypothetical protein
MIVAWASTAILTGRHPSLDETSMTFAHLSLFREPDDCSSSDEGFFFSILIERGAAVPTDIVEPKSDIALW